MSNLSSQHLMPGNGKESNAKCITSDFVIIGAGILGLSTALTLRQKYPEARISVIEKEQAVGLHASGRNSGVLHSGIYYPPLSMKAKCCAHGALLMRQYCQQHHLPLHTIGKVIVPTQAQDASILELLLQRGRDNGIRVEKIDAQQLRELEPATLSAIDAALYVPETAVVDSLTIVQHLFQNLQNQNVQFYFGEACQQIDQSSRTVWAGQHKIAYGHLINTAGLYADRIAAMCGLKDKYTMLPFKGLYYELTSKTSLALNHLIYPVPDMNVPFLGVHFTKSVFGKIYVGPTAVPALGREHYRGFKGINFAEARQVLYRLGQQYYDNQQGFRTYAHHEMGRFLKTKFVEAAQKLVPTIKAADLRLSHKVGIRAQLLDKKSRLLVMDFLTEQTGHETHVLNAVSPAFTSAFSFSQYVVDLIKG